MKKATTPESCSETLLSYAGNASNTSIDHLLELAEDKLNQQSVTYTTKKKVFKILIETLQNVYHHVDMADQGPEQTPVKFRLEKDNLAYTVIADNPVKNSKIQALQSVIDKFNSMSLSELKDYYRNKLSQGNFESGGGAGLGFVDIIRKSGKKISYSFKPVNKDYSYFSLQVRVST